MKEYYIDQLERVTRIKSVVSNQMGIDSCRLDCRGMARKKRCQACQSRQISMDSTKYLMSKSDLQMARKFYSHINSKNLDDDRGSPKSEPLSSLVGQDIAKVLAFPFLVLIVLAENLAPLYRLLVDIFSEVIFAMHSVIAYVCWGYHLMTNKKDQQKSLKEYFKSW